MTQSVLAAPTDRAARSRARGRWTLSSLNRRAHTVRASAGRAPAGRLAQPLLSRGTGRWLVPVLAAVAGWAWVLPWPAVAVLTGAALLGALTAAVPHRWLPLLGVLLAAGAGLPVAAWLAGSWDGLFSAGLAERLFPSPPLNPAFLHTLTVACWAAGWSSLRWAAAGAAPLVRVGPALLLACWATTLAEPTLHLPVIALVAGFLFAAAPTQSRRPALALILVLAAAAAALVRVLPLPVPAGARVDDPRPATVTVQDPLGSAAGWLLADPEPAFTVDRTEGPLRWAVLDSYDGLSWDAAGCSAARQGGTPAGRLTRITENRLPGPWLPVPAGTTGTDRGQLCPDTGTVLSADGVTEFQSWTGPADDPATPDDGRVHTLREDRTLATTLAGPGTGRAGLDRLAARLREGAYDPAAIPGQDRAALTGIAAGRRPGNQAQFAGSFALLAAAQGHPTRVVIGFQPTGRQVSTADVTIWPEVLLDGRWSRFDVLPESVTPTAQARLHREPAAGAEQPAVQPQPAQATPPRPATPEPRTPRWPWPVGGLLAAAGGALWWWRRRSGRPAQPAERVAAAWARTLRQLARVQPERDWRAMTPRQVAASAATSLSARTADLRELAELVTRAGYSGQSVTDDDAALAETRARRIAHAARRHRGPKESR